ncbi:flotillin family protein [Owenweeksia hongkongensis]|uniref:flotillin family protein n=1 Tax=Owenweeksia hongkongensis TaxID=253245 RepID=UPI003A8CD758
MSPIFLIAIAAAILFIFILIFSLVKRYKRCPSDRILVVYGKVGSNVEGNLSAKCIHGGAAFVWPIIQDYAFLDLTPTSIEVNLTNALSRQNIRVDVPSRFTVGISTEPGVMNNAAERLLGLTQAQVHDLAKDIIFGQLRLVVATMDIEEINNNRDKFLANVASNVEAELKKIGLKLINVNVTDIKDESGYIEALGKEAAAKAVNDARKSVAEKTRDGSIGEANANQEERIKVSDANANATVGEAAANARAVEGDNAAKITIANSDASRREAQAEANRLATAAEKVKQAQALEEAYRSEEKAEEARAERDKATQYANVVIPTSIDKQKVEIDAEAEAERIRRLARGQADAIYAKLEAEARGNYELLSKQAEGFKELVSAAGSDPRDAFMLLMAEKLPDIIKTQVEAIKNIKIDKVTVWDSLGKNGEGTNTSNFLSGMYKSVPPLEDLFNQAGLQLPDYLKGKTLDQEAKEATNDKPGNNSNEPEGTEEK